LKNKNSGCILNLKLFLWLSKGEGRLFQFCGFSLLLPQILFCRSSLFCFYDLGVHLLRFDAASIVGKITETPEGFVQANAVVTRTGVFLYRNADGTTRREYRPAEEVFHEDSLASMKLKPVTNLHPAENVTPENAAVLSVGSTGETIGRQPAGGVNEAVTCTLTVQRADGIRAIKNGRRQLSLGYSLELEETPGIAPDGSRYDAIQRKIRYNHLALVDSARAGDIASLRLDASDAVQVEECNLEKGGCCCDCMNANGCTKKQAGDGCKKDGCKSRNDSTNPNPNIGGMMQVTINGVQVDVPDSVGNELIAAKGRADAAEKQVEELKGEVSKVQGRADQLDADLKAAQNKDNADAINAAAKKRVAILGVASRVLNADGFKAVEDKTDNEVQLAVIMAKNPGFNADGRDQAYIAARFDAIAEALPAKSAAEQQVNSFVQQNNDSNEQNREDSLSVAAAYKKQNEALLRGDSSNTETK